MPLCDGWLTLAQAQEEGAGQGPVWMVVAIVLAIVVASLITYKRSG